MKRDNVMKIKLEKICDGILATVRVINGEKYYCLPEILEQLGLKSTGFNEKEKKPLTISAKIVWGFRGDALNLLETVFIDENSAGELIQAQSQQCC